MERISDGKRVCILQMLHSGLAPVEATVHSERRCHEFSSWHLCDTAGVNCACAVCGLRVFEEPFVGYGQHGSQRASRSRRNALYVILWCLVSISIPLEFRVSAVRPHRNGCMLRNV